MSNDGGPAFPSSNTPDTGHFAEGMTLRDYFAAGAMQGMLASKLSLTNASITREAFLIADSMIKARDA